MAERIGFDCSGDEYGISRADPFEGSAYVWVGTSRFRKTSLSSHESPASCSEFGSWATFPLVVAAARSSRFKSHATRRGRRARELAPGSMRRRRLAKGLVRTLLSHIRRAGGQSFPLHHSFWASHESHPASLSRSASWSWVTDRVRRRRSDRAGCLHAVGFDWPVGCQRRLTRMFPVPRASPAPPTWPQILVAREQIAAYARVGRRGRFGGGHVGNI